MTRPETGTRCNSNDCVDVKPTDAGVQVTSTQDGNDGLVTFTQAEWNQFIPEVKEGRWDHTVTP